jgi:tetratricopeptide (TPR) repeat protein
VSLAAIQKTDEALQYLTKAIQTDPTAAGKYHYNFGVVLLSVGRNADATEAFHRATEADPNYAEAQYQYGLALAMTAKPGTDGKLAAPAGAAEALQKYLELAPNGPNAKTAKDILAMYGK